MTRVLMIGYGPLPRPDLHQYRSPGLRTLQFFQAARMDRHDVHLYTLPMDAAESGDTPPELITCKHDEATYQHLTRAEGAPTLEALQKIVDHLKPAAIVAISAYPSYLAASMRTTAPMWSDTGGFWMSETQSYRSARGDDATIAAAWNIDRAILRRLDKFSAVSRPHLQAVLGQLATVGRLNRHTFEYPFGARVPNSAHRWTEPDPAPDQPELRGPVTPADAFIILWSGAFYPRVDIDSTMDAAETLMSRYPQVHLVATGGPVGALDGSVHARFQARIAASPNRERHHDLGWVEGSRLPRIYREANIGLNIDAPNYELMFGGRARVLAMAAEGLATVSVTGSEVIEWMEDARAVFTAHPRDPNSIVDAIEPWIEQPEKLKEYGQRARAIVDEDFTIEETTRAFRNWLKEPLNAPDNLAKIASMPRPEADLLRFVALNPLEEQMNVLDGVTPPAAQPEPTPEPARRGLGFDIKRLSERLRGR